MSHDHSHDQSAGPNNSPGQDAHAASAEEPATPRKPKQEQEQAQRELTEVAPGVLRGQLPIQLPGLGHVNCYILEDERGVAVVDPGLPSEDCWDALVDRLGQGGYEVDDIHTVVVTHSHFDHFGAADRIREASGADVLTHELFREAFEASEVKENEDSGALDANSEDAQEEMLRRAYDRKLPWGTKRTMPEDEQIQRMKKMGRFSKSWFRTPEPSIEVADTQVVKLGRREWIAVHTPGHTNDHLCLWDPEHGVMFSGDHVLPTITPHIGGFTPLSDPLAQFFDSLRRMSSFEGVTVALPAHGHPFVDLGGRADAIIEHHEERLDIIRNATHELHNGTVTDYMKILFRERSWGDMAESETYAHLQHLVELGELDRNDPDGIARYADASA